MNLWAYLFLVEGVNKEGGLICFSLKRGGGLIGEGDVIEKSRYVLSLNKANASTTSEDHQVNIFTL